MTLSTAIAKSMDGSVKNPVKLFQLDAWPHSQKDLKKQKSNDIKNEKKKESFVNAKKVKPSNDIDLKTNKDYIDFEGKIK